MALIEAVVEFDYTAQESDELTIKKGDKLTQIKVQSGGWWEGVLVRENRRGMFPDNFVKVLGEAANNDQVVMRKKPGRKCKVLFSYTPANNDELELHVDDIIDVLSEVEEGWWRGKLKNRVGVFPSNFVEEIIETREAVTRNIAVGQDQTSEATKPTIVDVMPPEVPSSPVPELDLDEPSPSVEVPSATIVTSNSCSSTTQLPSLPPKPVKELCKVLYAYDAVNEDELTIREEDLITLLSRDAPDKGWWRGELNGKVGLFPDNFVTVLSVSDEILKTEKPSPNKVTTNRIRDSITKPSETTAALRKSLDLSSIKKEEDKPPSPPVNVNKKPPPPIKKPQRSATTAAVPTSPNPSKHSMKFSLPFSSSSTSVSVDSMPSIEANNNKTQISIPSTPGVEDAPKRLSVSSIASDGSNPPVDSSDGPCLSRSSSYNVTSVSCNNSSNITSAITNHVGVSVDNSITRRPSSGGLSSDGEFEGVDRSAKLTHLTANRAKAPKRRPPSSILLKEDSVEEHVLMNGVAEPHVVEKVMPKMSPTPSVPWVEELKMNQAKKNSAQGKTRVTIGPFNSSSGGSGTCSIIETSSSTTSTTSTTTTKSNNVGVVFRSQRPASMFAPDVSSSSSSSTHAPSLVRNNSTSSCNKPPLPSNSVISPSLLSSSSIPVSNVLFRDNAATLNNNNNEEPLVVSTKQWDELVAKVSKLEHLIESQSTVINELTKMVKSGQEKQMSMQNEIDKLMDLVTQV